MPRKKQKKLDEVKTFENVFDYKKENIEDDLLKFFSDKNIATLELGCGQADYSINLALNYPQRNFIGIDRKASRLWNASKNARAANLNNAALMYAYIEKLAEVFKKIKVEEIWITFPDPYPRRGSMKKRLTHPRFLEVYKQILIPAGKINLKTDDDTLYNYTLQVIQENNLNLIKETKNLYAQSDFTFEETIQTKYEKQHLADGKTIKLISFCF